MNEFLKQAIGLSNESLQKNRFPAGALLVKGTEIIGKGLSGQYPFIHIHAETLLIDEAMEKYQDQLTGFEIFTSLEPCMMCIGKAYWAGIRKITYVLAKEDVNQNLAYETKFTTEQITNSLNDSMLLVQFKDKDLHDKALEIYKQWESKQN